MLGRRKSSRSWGLGLAPFCWVKRLRSSGDGNSGEVQSLCSCRSSVTCHSEVTRATFLLSVTRGSCPEVLLLEY